MRIIENLRQDFHRTVCRNLHVSQGRSLGPEYGPLGLFKGMLGTLKITYRVYSRYIRTPGLRAHTRGPAF